MSQHIPEQNAEEKGQDPLPESSVKIEQPAPAESAGFLGWIKNIVRPEPEPSLRDTLDEYINESVEGEQEAHHERVLLSNILRLRDMTVVQVMIPRADIVAIDVSTTQDELLALLAEKQFSRIPVYRGTLDDVLGTIHIKDVLATLARGEKIDIRNLIKEIPIVSPALPVLDLLLTMRQNRRHMALVVDEFGGIDGLVTVNDVLETIVGEIDDEHENGDQPKLVQNPDGSVLVDARLLLDDFESRFGRIFSEEDRESAETLSGLVFSIGGRIPGRGEILRHSSGVVFEIMDADGRRINLLKIAGLPKRSSSE